MEIWSVLFHPEPMSDSTSSQPPAYTFGFGVRVICAASLANAVLLLLWVIVLPDFPERVARDAATGVSLGIFFFTAPGWREPRRLRVLVVGVSLAILATVAIGFVLRWAGIGPQ
jgi:hypothetical protein